VFFTTHRHGSCHTHRYSIMHSRFRQPAVSHIVHIMSHTFTTPPSPLYCLCPHRTCWFHEARVGSDAGLSCEGSPEQHDQHAPLTTLMALEHTIQQRRLDMETQTGWCGYGMWFCWAWRARGGGVYAPWLESMDGVYGGPHAFCAWR
jgi:hypothetical protein